MKTAVTNTTTPEQQILLYARIGPHQVTFTASQLRDTVASYLARGERMPTPTDINGSDPIEHLHVIVEEWLYGNVQGWLNSADVVHLEKYRHQVTQWISATSAALLASVTNSLVSRTWTTPHCDHGTACSPTPPRSAFHR